jgi:hypothetical protein
MKTLRVFTIILIFSILLPVSNLTAQSRFELGFGWIFGSPDMNAAYDNQFVPPFTPVESYIGSSAGHSLNVDGKFSYGMTGFLNIFFTRHVGVQVIVDYFKPSLGGSNSDYTYSIDYRTTGDEARHHENVIEWPATDGNLTEITYSFNGIFRFPIPGSFSAALSGGFSIFNVKGKAVPMGFTKFWRDAEDTLYINTFRMVYDFGPKTQYGFNVGGELSYLLFRLLVVSVEVRRFQCAADLYQMNITEDPVLDDPPEVIEGILDLGSLSINPSYTRFSIALRMQF